VGPSTVTGDMEWRRRCRLPDG